MISIYKNNNVSNVQKGGKELEYRGLSTDEKPTEKVENGSIFIEMDTGTIYLYDLENEEWKEI